MDKKEILKWAEFTKMTILNLQKGQVTSDAFFKYYGIFKYFCDLPILEGNEYFLELAKDLGYALAKAKVEQDIPYLKDFIIEDTFNLEGQTR